MRFQSYFNTAISLITTYDGSVPLVHFLKHYFSQHKKHGSKDRRFIAHLCYCFYRLGHSLYEISVEEKLKAAIYLCNNEAGEWHILFNENWNEWSADLNDRILFLQNIYPSFLFESIFLTIYFIFEYSGHHIHIFINIFTFISLFFLS